jgi:hypothetical protein
MKELNKMTDVFETPNFHFLLAQMQMLLIPKNNFRYSKHTSVLAAELLCVSPAAYRMIRRSGILKLPKEQAVRELMSNSLQDQNVSAVFQEIQPQQRLVNLISDEVKLKSALRFTSGHVLEML